MDIRKHLDSKLFRPLSKAERMCYAGAVENDSLILTTSEHYHALYSEGTVILLFAFMALDGEITSSYANVPTPAIVDFKYLQREIDSTLNGILSQQRTLADVEDAFSEYLLDTFDLELLNTER